MAVPEHLLPTKPLMTYRPEQQRYGEFLSGFDWRLYCTGTFRRLPENDHEAEIMLKRFVRQLADGMQYDPRQMAYCAVLEDRYPGIGGKAIRKHWHFLLACPDHPLLRTVAKQLWMANGWATIGRYDPAKAGAYYISKLIGEGAIPYERNLDKLSYQGPADLQAAIADSRYVQPHLKTKHKGEFLVVNN